ncbi:MAG TPA: LamG domain-containing protein [Longimicrobium sp.]|jgi:hypothetical protein
MRQQLLPFVRILVLAAAAGACKGGADSDPAIRALRFDGVDDFVQVPASPSLNVGTGDFTWEIWLKRDSIMRREDVLTKKDVLADSEHDAAIYFDRDGTVNAFLRSHPLDRTAIVASQGGIGTGWTHIAMVRSSGLLKLYVNGGLHGSASAPFSITSSGPLRIGANRVNNTGAEGAPVFPFVGLVDEVRIWNVARTDAQISAAASQQCSQGTAPGLVASYQFEQKSGTTLPDASGTGNVGTLRNGPVWVAGAARCPAAG